ncbi:MAG: FKBP-type peptidyl-prolyl cis-trans isomerase [Armatimonadetes bacterium]|nr:FKBP-type peptidyl-prolyl cis-trans isomerase [Armatimonadota bacterium]
MKNLLAMLMLLGMTWPCLAQEPQRIAPGKEVTIELTVSLPDASPVASTVGKEPITYIYGGPSEFPELQKGLKGVAEGESKLISLPPEQAFGPIDPTKIIDLPLADVPQDARQVGTILTFEDGHNAIVREIHPDTVTVDANHPLAGKTLIFDVKVLRVKDHAR